MSAAADLLATDAPESISVADIARHAGLTSAAIYYHFRSRDELVDEIVRTFAVEWSAVVTAALSELDDQDKVSTFIATHFDWIEANSHRAMVYFVSSIGATSVGESIRRDTRHTLTLEAAKTIERLTALTSAVDVTVRALGLINLLEVGASDILRGSPSYRTLGKAGMRRALTDMLHKLLA